MSWSPQDLNSDLHCNYTLLRTMAWSLRLSCSLGEDFHFGCFRIRGRPRPTMPEGLRRVGVGGVDDAAHAGLPRYPDKGITGLWFWPGIYRFYGALVGVHEGPLQGCGKVLWLFGSELSMKNAQTHWLKNRCCECWKS